MALLDQAQIGWMEAKVAVARLSSSKKNQSEHEGSPEKVDHRDTEEKLGLSEFIWCLDQTVPEVQFSDFNHMV